MDMKFDLTGMQMRERKTPCKQCGSLEHCDACWEHVSDWSPFGIWHCLLCQMPMFVFNDEHAPKRCDFCGWDERTETVTAELNEKGEWVHRSRENDPESKGPPR